LLPHHLFNLKLKKMKNYSFKLKIKKDLISFLLLFLLLFTISKKVFSQQVSLSISPPLIETIIKPGKSIMIAYTIKNFGDPTYLKTKVVSFEPKDNQGNVRLKNDLQGPIRFELDNADLQLERPFFLRTGASQQILLRIRAPEGAPLGDYYYTLLAETIPSGNLDEKTITQAKATIGSNILITVTNSGIIEVKPKVVIFDVLNKFKIFNKKINLFDSFDKIPVLLILENKGKNLIKPEGEIILKDSFGNQIKYQIIPKNILAESQRVIEATESSKLTEPTQNPITLVLSGFFLGPYHLSTKINFGENSPTIFANTQFFSFPFKLTVIIIFLIIIIIYLTKKLHQDEEID